MLTVAYLGPEQTNTHLAARKRFGPRARYVHAPTVEDVFRLVERRQAGCGVVPIENSLEGAVTHTLDRFVDFVDTPVRIQGEVEQPIRHALITRRGVAAGKIREVYSHPQALAQCHRWLNQQLPRAARRETTSTAEAVRFVLESPQGRHRAAIGRRELAAGRALQATAIPEARDNKTRFLILGLEQPGRGRRNKTAIFFALKDKPGALYDALMPFKRNRINLTKIESRPSKRKAWEYLFFIDLEGHEQEPRVKRALAALAKHTMFCRVLGSYPISKS
jgi:chorismate mutase/prephenate dehydratase